MPIVQGVRRGNTPEINPGTAHFSVSNTGALIYVPGPVSLTAPDQELVRLDLKGGLEPLKLPRGRYETPRVSPDGKRLAFGTEDAQRSDRLDLRAVRCELDAPAHGRGKKSLSDLVCRRRTGRVSVGSRR